mmetsp:Transcript_2732/g.6487  ORF Transcript_2732/g.6487 Transcript_2732/m.6487 type:complete len:696 (+) Transcript_2732:196-2283(+)
MYDSIGDDESNSLLPGSGRRIDTRTFASKKSLMINRIFVILLLAGLVAVSIWLESFQTELNEKLSTDELKIKNLEETVEAQGKIIARFNESVTNTDVVDKLNAMELQWENDSKELFKELSQTKTSVEAELNSTMIELDETVKKAETEIHEQVDSVKKNFEQYVIKTENQFSMENDFMKYQVAGTFTILSCLISMWHMGSHTRNLEQPAIQRKILAILWMCPIYAVTSCLSLVFPAYSAYLGILKDFYEAYIIYQFLSFCISAIGGGDRNKVIGLLAKNIDHLSPPFRIFFCCCKPHYENDVALANAILIQCQFFAMQFVFWKPVTSISMLVLKKYDYYGPYADNALDWKSFQSWIVIIENISTFVAFAGLLKFYHAVDKELAWCRPFAKFLCIKGVVFMTFWQGSALKILAETTDVGGDSTDDWSEQIQNFLICLEMLLFSIAHFYCFPVEEWQPGYKVNFRKAKFGESLALSDFFADLKIIMTDGGSSKKKKKKKKHSPSEDTIPEEDEEATLDDSESAMDDEEDAAKDALVRKLESGMRAYEDDDDNGESESQTVSIDEEQQLHYAQERLGNMLGEMLFFPEDSSRSRPSLTPNRVSALTVENGNIGDDEDDDKEQNGGVDEESGIVDDSEIMEDLSEVEEDPQETMGLLTGEHATSLRNNLRPSIFTTVSEHQTPDPNGLWGTNEEEKEKDE